MTAIVLPLVESDVWGLGSVKTLGLLGAGAALMLAFWAVEHRVEQPIVDFALFRNGPYFGASAAAFALVGAYWSLMFFQPQYLQGPLGHSATATGLLILPITAPMIVISPLAGRMIARFGARGLMTAGMLCGVVGLIFMTQISDDSGYGLLLPGYLLFGVALGLVYAPMSSAAMAAMPPEKTGIASGVLAMNRVLAGAVALAVTGAVFQSLLGTARLPDRPGTLELGPGGAGCRGHRPHLAVRALGSGNLARAGGDRRAPRDASCTIFIVRASTSSDSSAAPCARPDGRAYLLSGTLGLTPVIPSKLWPGERWDQLNGEVSPQYWRCSPSFRCCS